MSAVSAIGISLATMILFAGSTFSNDPIEGAPLDVLIGTSGNYVCISVYF
jgi:hypothetical protein